MNWEERDYYNYYIVYVEYIDLETPDYTNYGHIYTTISMTIAKGNLSTEEVTIPAIYGQE